MGRRSFVISAGGVVALAAGSAVASRWIRAARSVESTRRTTVIPRPVRSNPPPVQTFSVPGLSPYVTPNAEFYRIDTALSTPQVRADAWRLRISGLLEEPFELTYDDLLALDSIEETVTLQCVSNEIGGDLIGNALWQGAPLAQLLDRARPTEAATQIVGRSIDGFTAGFPLANALDGRTAIVAYAMNGEPLPAAHGYPARLVVAGLYGYVSATKWLTEIELTGWNDVDGYWITRGWSKEGPVKLGSRIDVPRSGDVVLAGRPVVAGVAWAPPHGVERVEVQLDDGPWMACTLGAVASGQTWVQWILSVDVQPGNHSARVRAIDTEGRMQTSDVSDPAPDGATGWHHRTFTASP